LKCATDELGKAMMEAEFCSMTELYHSMPSNVPKPIAWGQFQNTSPETYYLLLEYIDLCMDLVDPVEFCEQIATLHKTSKSPTGKFGFQVDTFQGPSRQITEWNSDWCDYFTKLIDGYFSTDIELNGPNEQFEKAYETLKAQVIPKILKPLQADGKSIKPCLLHGDLWEENTGTNLVTGKIMIFDASAHYCHNEFELGMWRREVIRFGKVYFRQYLRNFPPSEPVEQWDDRNRLYSLKYNLSQSIAWPASVEATREMYEYVLCCLKFC
jgi:protein-ribulosamine 3-kinase